MTQPARKQPDDPTRVFLLVENYLVRVTLDRLFRKRSDLHVVGQASSSEALDEILASQCDIVILDDLHTASLLGPHLLGRLQALGALGVVLIDMQDDEEQFLEAVLSGVSGYLLSNASANDIISAVLAVARGEAVCPPRLCLAFFRLAAQGAVGVQAHIRRGAMHGLTILQQQVISLVAKGLTNKEIASQANLSEFTIRNHIYRIMKQLGVESRFEMVEVVRGFGYGGLA